MTATLHFTSLPSGIILQRNDRSFASIKDECHIQTERIGCFKDAVIPSRPIPVLLFTDRDPTSPVYTGGFIDLKNWNLYMDDLKCRCSEEAKGKGYKVFGLQWYGECWSGPKAHETYNINGPSDQCVTHDLAHCTDEEEECVGRDFVNFVYEIIAANASHNASGKHIHNHTLEHNETRITTGYNNTHLHGQIHHHVTLTTPAPTTAPKP
ncbi:uncharacterized protein LOC116305038, partial [Actinia tenebrosa]|uniref:Uncharacterized protein LOC116305038 n=1 Tax=Actinia tenebrosa TaxID=6105 RepID=A0A6P8IUJ1_ACTTE